MSEKRTPTPWTFHTENLRGGKYYVIPRGPHAEPIDIHEDENGAQDVPFIVRSVNAHDDLVQALRKAREYVNGVHRYIAGAIGHDQTVIKPDLDMIDAALAKAGGAS